MVTTGTDPQWESSTVSDLASSSAAAPVRRHRAPRVSAARVRRPDVADMAGLGARPVTLVCAPAGYGKTAALTRQIRQLPESTALAWVCADEDDHLQRFLACLCTALEPYDLPWRMAPDALPTLAQSERGLRGVATELVNALAASERPRGLKSEPPLPPPIGMPVSAFLNVCSNPRNLIIPTLTEG